MTRTEHARLVQSVTTISAITLLQDAGYDIEPASGNLMGGIIINGTLRVQIHGALWTKHKHSKGRYQFNIHTKADVFVLVCFGPLNHYFVIPRHAIGDHHNIAIWSKFPGKYVGRWTQYCDAWHIIDQELARCQNPTA